MTRSNGITSRNSIRVVDDGPVLSGDLLREVCRVQNAKTIQAVIEILASIRVTENDRHSYSQKNRSAQELRDDLLSELRKLRDEGDR